VAGELLGGLGSGRCVLGWVPGRVLGRVLGPPGFLCRSFCHPGAIPGLLFGHAAVRPGAGAPGVAQDGRVRRPLVPLAALALALVASGCTGRGAATAASATPRTSASGVAATATPAADLVQPPAIAWTSCRDGFQCSALTVPLDYANRSKGTVSLRLIRLPASDPAHRVGALLINPGGPGVSAVDFVRGFAKGGAPAALHQRFDMVAFDPRGTTGSAPVHCLDTAQLDRFFHVDPQPDDPAEIRDLDQENRLLAAGCARRSGRILPYVTTDIAARDMDSVRAALREPKLTYLGYSYGTALGAAYLDQFPTRVRAMVLDGALDPRSTWDQVLAGQARGFEQAFGSWLAWCNTHRTTCAFRRAVPGDLGAAYDAIAAKVDKTPLPGAGKRTVGPGELSYGAGQALYSTSYWGFLGDALADAQRGDGNLLLQLSDLYLERTPTGYSNAIEANFAVNCADKPWPKDIGAYQKLADRMRKEAPRFGPSIAWSGEGCAVWPVPATGRPHAVTGNGSPPILVIGTTRDPATPYVWAQGLAAQLAHGVLLTHVGDGHTAYSGAAPTCIVGPVNAYLITAKAPAPARC
jgi:pimeloyl-ACP methyl ester carboxylesterase